MLQPDLDAQIAQWLHAHATPPLTQILLWITHLHSVGAICTLTAVLALYFVSRREWRWVAAAALAVPGGLLLNTAVKHAVQRARPQWDEPLLMLTTYSFPSGHTAGAVLFYGLLVAYLFSRTRAWPARLGGVGAAILLAALAGFSRLYLGVHYLTDVLGAAVVSLAWLVLCLALVHKLADGHPRHH